MIIRKKYEDLTLNQLYDILQARNAVFIVEQTCPYQDIDGVDPDCTHVMLYEGEDLKAYARVFEKRDEPGTAQIGRVLTLERGKGYGNQVLEECIDCALNDYGMTSMYLEAQVYAVGYYKKHGFQVCSEVFLEDDIPHVQMRRK